MRDRTGDPFPDPLDDEGPDCSRSCENGWITVQPGYSAREHPNVPPEMLALLDANTVYPCPRHRPDTFQRWVHGHFNPDHQCGECVEVRKGRAHA